MKKVNAKDVGMLFMDDFLENRGEPILADSVVKLAGYFIPDELGGGEYIPPTSTLASYESVFCKDFSHTDADVVYKYSVLFDRDKFINGIVNSSMVLNELLLHIPRIADKAKTFELFENGLIVTFVAPKCKKNDVMEEIDKVTNKSRVKSKSLLVIQEKNGTKEFLFEWTIKITSFPSVLDNHEEVESLMTVIRNCKADKRYEVFVGTKVHQIEYLIALRTKHLFEVDSHEKVDTCFMDVKLTEENVDRIGELVRYVRSLKIVLMISNEDNIAVNKNMLDNTIKAESARKILGV